MLEKLFSKISRALDKEKIPYMVIGGQAVLLYGSPRLTRDIDITLGIDTDGFDLIKAICRKINLKLLPDNPESFAAETKVLPTEDPKSGIRADFIFSFTEYEKKAIKRAVKVKLGNYPVRFASAEDVIIHKMFAGRAVDQEDVKNIIIKMKNKLDAPYIRKWLKSFASLPEHKKILNEFNALFRKT